MNTVGRGRVSIAAVAAMALSGTMMATANAATAVARVEGPNRYATAVAVSKTIFPDAESAETVVLARGDDFADALAGSPLAAAMGAPLLLTNPTSLTGATAEEIKRVLKEDGTVYILGGEGAISNAVLKAVEDLRPGDEPKVERLGGDNRFETAVTIADETTDDPESIMLSTGEDFPDALAAGAAAGNEGSVVLLTRGRSVGTDTLDYLKDHAGTKLYAIGGPAATAAGSAKLSAQSIIGTDRYETAVKVAQTFFGIAPDGLAVASGMDFPDALAGGAASGQQGYPILLTKQDELSKDTKDYATAAAGGGTASAFVVGGPGAVAEKVLDELKAAMNPTPPVTPTTGTPTTPPVTSS